VNIATFTKMDQISRAHGQGAAIWDIVYSDEGRRVVTAGSSNYVHLFQLTQEGRFIDLGEQLSS